jgi:hypothetical protein
VDIKTQLKQILKYKKICSKYEKKLIQNILLALFDKDVILFQLQNDG